MAKRRSRARNYLEYVLFRLIGCFFNIIPIKLGVWIVESLADLAFRADRRHREIALDNLRIAFPDEYTDAQRLEIVRKVYRHFAVAILELLLFTRKIHAANVDRLIDASEYPDIEAAFRSGRPVILLTAHFGNWELAAHYLGLMGIRTHLVGRSLSNPYVSESLRKIREWTGHTVLEKNGDVRRMRQILDAGGGLCTVGDQDAGPQGMFVDFFGKPASTHKAIAHLANKTGALIAVVGMERKGGILHYRVRLVDIVDPADYAGRADADRAITQRCSAAIEEMIRAAPHQYLWLHRRWKHQPQTILKFEAYVGMARKAA